jgi:hypothetical protein
MDGGWIVLCWQVYAVSLILPSLLLPEPSYYNALVFLYLVMSWLSLALSAAQSGSVRKSGDALIG